MGSPKYFQFWGRAEHIRVPLAKLRLSSCTEDDVRERCSLRSRLCLCSAKFLYRMGSAYRLHRRTCYTKKEPPRRISEVLKVAATSSPTIFRSAVPSAMLSLCPVSLSAALAPLRFRYLPPLPAPLLCRLSAPRARERAHRTPHTVRTPHRRHRARL